MKEKHMIVYSHVIKLYFTLFNTNAPAKRSDPSTPILLLTSDR